MITDPVALPSRPPSSGQPGRLPSAGALRLGSVALPPGRPLVARETGGAPPPPVIWATDDVVPGADRAWAAVAAQFPCTGLWPLLLQGLYDGSGRPWSSGELSPVPETTVDDLEAEAVLRDGWSGWLVPINNPWAPGTGPLTPFGPDFPGLAATQPTSDAAMAGEPRGSARLGLVSCRRPADTIGVMGWLGAINYRQPAEVSGVLRSWEERFGAIPVGLGFATLTLLVTRPPRTEDDALRAAAEVAALCPDALWQPESLPPYVERDCTLEALAAELAGQPIWRLWWD